MNQLQNVPKNDPRFTAKGSYTLLLDGFIINPNEKNWIRNPRTNERMNKHLEQYRRSL